MIDANIPQSWALTPVNGKKAYRDDWQTESPVSRDAIESAIATGEATGYGLRTGKVSGGLIAIDCDGQTAITELIKLSDGKLPRSIGWTSGKQGRKQVVFQIPDEFRSDFAEFTKHAIKTGQDEQLEFRYNGHQSVLPPSVHPETGSYQWIKSPADQTVAIAPDWLIMLLLEQIADQRERTKLAREKAAKAPKTGKEIDKALEYISYLGSEYRDEYDLWLHTGMALHSVSPGLLETWIGFSRDSSKFVEGECEYKWGTFTSGKGHGIEWLGSESIKCGRPKADAITKPAKPETVDDSNPGVTFLQQAENELFGGDRWIAVNGILYRWEGTHYEPYPDEKLTPKIKRFADSFPVKKTSRDGIETVTYPHAKPTSVTQVLEWVKHGFAIPHDAINPAGINCTNGFLELHWNNKTLITRLVPHDPDRHYCLSEPLVKYDPDCDPTDYERLMECLDPKPRDIWERTIAASIDLEAVRKYRGRAVRAVFLKGDGQNGKDTLRMITAMTLGNGAIASCSAIDWKQYDQGRYFPVYALRGKRLNWPSENADVGRIDALKGLRAAITGDPITFEAKNKMGTQEPSRAVFLFNINEAPNIVAKLKATESRWGIIPFTQTYSANPKQGELLADPRFKEDPDFIKASILPAFLNRLIDQLQNVVNHGIDYSATQGIFEELQRESCHLLQFAEEAGLEYNPASTVTIAELWEQLEAWYMSNGTLVIEEPPAGSRARPKRVWHDQPNTGDRNVKGANQVLKRFLEIFPKAKRGTQESEDGNRNKVAIISGLGFAEQKNKNNVPKVGTLGTQGTQTTEPQGVEARTQFDQVGTQTPKVGTQNLIPFPIDQIVLEVDQ